VRSLLLLFLVIVLGLALILGHAHQLLFGGAREELPFSQGGAAQPRKEVVSRSAAADFSDACQPGAGGEVGTPHSERWGDVVVNAVAGKGHEAASAGACCSACVAHRDCNVWVWCSNPASCGSQCWLKRSGKAAELESAAHGAGEGVPWTSGVVRGKALDLATPVLPAATAGGIGFVALSTKFGDIKLRLRPEWSPESVAFVRAIAAAPELCTSACEIYRVEPGFLLQGSLRSRIPPNNVTREGPRFMVRGDVGWAGGSAGPDWFIYLGDQPASHWGLTHTVWAEVADEASFAVAEKCVLQPPLPTKPGEMHIIAERIPISPKVAAAPA